MISFWCPLKKNRIESVSGNFRPALKKIKKRRLFPTQKIIEKHATIQEKNITSHFYGSAQDIFDERNSTFSLNDTSHYTNS